MQSVCMIRLKDIYLLSVFVCGKEVTVGPLCESKQRKAYAYGMIWNFDVDLLWRRVFVKRWNINSKKSMISKRVKSDNDNLFWM